MFVARYDTYAISLLADEALQWRRALTAGKREDKLIGLELTLDTGKKLQSMPKKKNNAGDRFTFVARFDTYAISLLVDEALSTHCRQEGGQVDQHGAHVGHWQEAAVYAVADHQ